MSAVDARNLEVVELFKRCSQDRFDSEIWTEFQHRFTAKIRLFLRRAFRQALGFNDPNLEHSGSIWNDQEEDFFQNVVVKLVERDCAVMKRFVGTTESDLLAYFAVIARSVVRDHFRRQRARKRPGLDRRVAMPDLDLVQSNHRNFAEFSSPIEREVLAREIAGLCLRTIKNHSGEDVERDRLIFLKYFHDGMSTAQIADEPSIGLTKQGVEKVLNRLKDRVRSVAASDSSEVVI